MPNSPGNRDTERSQFRNRMFLGFANILAIRGNITNQNRSQMNSANFSNDMRLNTMNGMCGIRIGAPRWGFRFFLEANLGLRPRLVLARPFGAEDCGFDLIIERLKIDSDGLARPIDSADFSGISLSVIMDELP